MLSVVIPTFNELKSGYLPKIIPNLLAHSPIEIIAVDSFSQDGTYEYLQKFPIKCVQVNTTSRAIRLNKGIELANGDLILLHHPRSLIESIGIQYLLDHEKDLTWGGFSHRFDQDHPLLKFTSWYSNHVRADLRQIFYLDHCLFVKKELLHEIGLIPPMDIFEDTKLSLKLKEKSKSKRLPFLATTSAIRFKQNGILKHAFKNQILKLKYYMNIDHQKMNQDYEKKVALNANYENRND